MHFDSVAQKEQERNFMVWFQRLLQSEPEQTACRLAGKHRPGNGLTAVRWKTGGYNVTYRVTYDDGFQAIVRFAALGQSLYRTEKVENEAIVLQYLRKHTKIPVPRLLGVGKIALAPYIVEESVEGDLASEPFHINAVIDLEFTYAAPIAFTYAAPWWLLLQNPEQWELGLKGKLLPRDKPRLCLFLEALREVEEEQIKSNKLIEAQRLSERMEQSMDNGLFWFCLAIRNAQMFDDIYWTFLDEMFFGPLDKLEDRIQFLDEEEKVELNTLYEVKQKQANYGTLDLIYHAMRGLS
ncbi:hypothetical protein BPOR_0181g00020 [Botrytis porri]|uniref:Aminoglycoside phosphotransferase domain-containing protein n=1 Tax=Botrytis porri TaxID=87229 RepID=A0A4Z1KUE3_9HELO|nr:hypothetical protein BPOR_0181g00020 [Botrytis porri]